MHRGNKDWMKLACKLGMKLQIVISMRELPPWTRADEHPEYYEQRTSACTRIPNEGKIQTPSVANEYIWKLLLNYTQSATRVLFDQYGSCIHSISPTLNNEFETRYSQTHNAMRDYSTAAMDRYKEWQIRKGYAKSLDQALKPHPVQCGPLCEPLRGEKVWHWLGFREEFLADRYISLCQAIKEAWSSSSPTKCFLHIGEMLAITDNLNSNIFFHLAKSSAVDELVMDSNMMLSGAPTSPSVVGLMVSTAKLYSKTVHYEVATERVLPCSSDGKPMEGKDGSSTTKTMAQLEHGAPLLLRAGVQHALEAGIESLGVTNLCQPALVSTVLPFELAPTKTSSADSTAASSVLKRSSQFQPTAMIFVPYRVFSAFSLMTTGIHCHLSPVQCWHDSFADLTFFNEGQVAKGTCPIDAMQHAVLKVWDELRLRHEQIVVVGDASMLEKHPTPILARISERVVVRFPCLMNKSGWHFYNGEEDRNLFEAFRAEHPFDEYVAHNVC